MKPTTGTVCFEGACKGVLISEEDASSYFDAVQKALVALEKNPGAVDQLGLQEVKALKSLASLFMSPKKGRPFFQFKNMRDCLKVP